MLDGTVYLSSNPASTALLSLYDMLICNVVPSNGRRLRAEFVYRSVIQCADEIRHRGKHFPHKQLQHNDSMAKSRWRELICILFFHGSFLLHTTRMISIRTARSDMDVYFICDHRSGAPEYLHESIAQESDHRDDRPNGRPGAM